MLSSISLLNQQDQSTAGSSVGGTIGRIQAAIKQASLKTGVDFSYLLNKASQESGFDPNAKASTSSATGLFQFTQQTWLQMVKTNGSQYGLGQYADQISVDSTGTAHVSDPKARTAILALRNDPTVSAEMAGELDKQNLDALQSGVGGKIGPTELYLAHFLGASGANDFIKEMRKDPNADAASVLPDAANSNPSVFYDKSGNARTMKQIYQHFAAKFNSGTGATTTSATAVASAPQATSASSRSFSAPIASFASYAMPGTGTNNISAPASSLYATMVLAQMDSKNSSDNSWSADTVKDGHKKDPRTIAIPVTIS